MNDVASSLLMNPAAAMEEVTTKFAGGGNPPPPLLPPWPHSHSDTWHFQLVHKPWLLATYMEDSGFPLSQTFLVFKYCHIQEIFLDVWWMAWFFYGAAIHSKLDGDGF